MITKYFSIQRTLVIVALTMAAALGVAVTAFAQGPTAEMQAQLKAAAGTQGANLGDPVDPRVTVSLIIRAALGMTTIVLIILNIYAGVMWMTAGGNDEKVEKAKTTLRNATIGLVIVLSAYSITVFATYIARGQQFGLGGGPNALSRGLGNFFGTHEGPN